MQIIFHNMMCLSFVTLLGLSWVLLRCEGQVYPPFNQTVVLPGSNVTINWTYVGDPSKAYLFWYFTKRGSSNEQEIAVKNPFNPNGTINDNILPAIAIEDPATLILKNVDERYDGKYRLNVLVARGGGESSVEFFVAATPTISVNCSNPTRVIEGDYFACECKGTDGNPPAHVTWYKDNTKKEPIDTGKEKASFVLSKIDKDDKGTYICEAKSGIEEAKNTTSIKIIVHSTPKITVNCSNPTTVNQSDNFACECKGTDGSAPANVTWYKDNRDVSATGREIATLVLIDVHKNDSGTYRCEARTGIENLNNETSIELIVNYAPKNVLFTLARSGQRALMNCTAEGRPEPSFKIFGNCGSALVKNDKTYTIPEVNICDVGYYKCIAENILGNTSSVPEFLSLEPTALPPTTTLPSLITSQTTTNGTDKPSSNNMTCGTEWYIIILSLVCGIIMGVLLCYIVWRSHRRWFRKRKPKRNPDEKPTEADSTYQELDVSKMNQEDNYQSLRGNVARINDVTNDDESTYTELSKTRDVEDNYQSLT